MIGSMYQSTRGKNALGAVTGNSAITIKSPTTGEDIRFTLVELDSAQVLEKTVKNQYNKRNDALLTRASLLDILPEIERDKRNTQPAIALQTGDTFNILSGMRRRTAVSLVKDAKLVMLVAKSLSTADQRAFAFTSDVYKEPSFLDLGFTLTQFKTHMAEQGVSLSTAELAEEFEIATGKASEVMRFAALPNALYRPFPDLSLIQYRFMRQMIKLQSIHPEAFSAVVSTVREQLETTLSDPTTLSEQSDVKKRTTAVQTAFLSALNADPTLNPSQPVTTASQRSQFWSQVADNAIDGCTVKLLSRDSGVTIKLDHRKLPQETLDAIAKLIQKG
ncbi:hypothetical protein [Pseudoalteromonas rubra]|uniref:Chromosome partitioning protein ParB n=1 Tax=Pseudoalteromonas rubra TaxID=43658 RepID=A0A0U3I863_9GAMM|nr:hypothetical protein [Pseudoalteromonas rubra]ALU46166.1 hypothetical protein AT705_24700 [Pseudoalteromonas rubra]